jgi:ABC-type Na+ efflux pump permease subunit
MMLWLVPMVSFLVIGLVVMISAKVRGYQEANSIAGAVVLPIVLVTIGQVAGVMYFSPLVVFFAGVVFLAVNALLFHIIARNFHRDRLIAYMK